MSHHPPLGVGFVGAGPVVQAIHLPTLARLTGSFSVERVFDVDEAVAESVAGRCGARSTTDLQVLLDDPAVDVVVVCSPHPFHAEQVVAAARAGKRAVLCEKPLASTVEEANTVAEAVQRHGVPLLVGAMHLFDPAWTALRASWGDFPQGVHTVRSSIVLPPNSRFEDVATEVVGRSAARGGPALDATAAAAATLTGGVMGLAIHDLPLVRALLADGGDVCVLTATPLAPWGYLIELTVGDVFVELHAVVGHRTWKPDWRLDAWSAAEHLHIDFPPSYVHAGSATASLRGPERTVTFGAGGVNGYEGEWRLLADVVRTGAPGPDVVAAVADLAFAVTIADQAAALVRTGGDRGAAAGGSPLPRPATASDGATSERTGASA